MPADDKNWFNQLASSIMEYVVDVVAFITCPMQTTAVKTAIGYWKTMLVGVAELVPAVTVLFGGPATISQQQELVRKPDEHVPSQSQQAPTAEPMRSLMVAATSASSTFLTGEEFAGSQGEVRYVVHVVHPDESPSPAPPLPNLKSTEDDNLS